jgi:hypothetical protein
MGSTTSVTAPVPPDIALFVSVTAHNPDGAATSNEVSFTVASALPPTPVLHPPVVTGQSVAFSWSPGGTGDRYILRARMAADGPVIAQVPLAAPTVTFPVVPSGTYVISVVAVNGDLQSAESNRVSVIVH